jgi:prolyl 4-hydroxylase
MEKECLDLERVFLIHDFLSDEECQRYIQRSEHAGYEDAPISTASGFVMRKDIRDNDRLVSDDPALAAEWFERARPFLPEEYFGWRLTGINERFRYYRYDPGQKFAPHTDGYFQRDNGERSQLTLMVYLNDGFEGGSTSFHHLDPTLHVRPVAGMALVFMHRVVHEGAPVIAGRKYVLRTDVMYARI